MKYLIYFYGVICIGLSCYIYYKLIPMWLFLVVLSILLLIIIGIRYILKYIDKREKTIQEVLNKVDQTKEISEEEKDSIHSYYLSEFIE